MPFTEIDIKRLHILTRSSTVLVLALLSVVAVLALLLAVAVGSVSLSMPQALQGLQALYSQQDNLAATLLQLRGQRALVAFVTGGSLALSGCLMQTLLRNPLADPYILGLSGGSAAGALMAMLLACAAWMVNLAAFCGALLAMLLVATFARQDLLSSRSLAERSSRLLLTGVVLAAGWGALVTLFLSLAPDGQLRSMVFWLMGDLGGAEWHWWPAAVLVLVLVVLLRFARALNVMALGADVALNLGVRVAALRRLLFICGSLLAAVAVTNAGSIGFVGLIVPHACRMALGPDQRLLLPASVLVGGTFLVLADTLARTLVAPLQLPVGVITALIGAPIFLWQLAHERR